MTPKWIIMGGLVLSPLVLCSGLLGVLRLGSGFRRSFGASGELSSGAMVVVGLFLLVHAGFGAAPFLVAAGKRGLALWVTTPVAIIGTLAVAALVMKVLGDGAEAGAWVTPGLIAFALLGYVLPVVLLGLA